MTADREARARPGPDRAAVAARAVALMSRPDQLLLMIAVYGAGAALAVARGAPLDPWLVAAGYLVFLPVAASVHFANEYADYGTDALTERTPFSGGSGALVGSGLPRRLALRAAWASLLVGAAATAWGVRAGVVDRTGLALLVVVAVLGWGYSLPPLALAWRGAGEVDNALLGGVVLPVYGASVVGDVTVATAAAFVPFGCAVFVNLLATTWPDRRADAAVGKRTLATRLPPASLRRVYAVGVAAAAVALAALAGSVPPVVWYGQAAGVVALAVAARWYTRRRSPFPTVAAMVGFAVVTLLAWGAVALGVAAAAP